MRKILAIVLLVSLVLFVAVSVAADWQLKKEFVLGKGVTGKIFVSKGTNEEKMVYYVKGGPIYQQWQEEKRILASVRVVDKWMQGEALLGYAPFEEGKIVFFLLIKGEPKKFEFLLN